MSMCKVCGKKGLFLRVDKQGICDDCQFKQTLKEISISKNSGVSAKRKETDSNSDILGSLIHNKSYNFDYGTLEISAYASSRYIEVRQKTPGILAAISRESWAGYISPSGGFVNFGKFQVIGKKPETNRKNKRIYYESEKKYACKRAEIDGLVEPFEVNILPMEAPSERQLAYVSDLGGMIPEGACAKDVSAIISRITDDDEESVDDNISKWAHMYGVHFSLYSGYKEIMRLALQLPIEDYHAFLDSIKSRL